YKKNLSIGARDAGFGHGKQAKEETQGQLRRNSPAGVTPGFGIAGSIGHTSNANSVRVDICITIEPPPPSDDRERDDIDEATLLSLALQNKLLRLLKSKKTWLKLEPGSHNENPKTVDDNDEEEKKDDKKDDDDNDDYDDHALLRNKVTCSLEIIEELFKTHIKNNFITVHPTSTSTATITSADLKQQLYLKMKRNLQDQSNDLELWDVLKRKFEKSSTSHTSCRNDAFCKRDHDNHQEDNAPPKGEKRAKRQKTSKGSKSASNSSSKQQAQGSKTYVYEHQQQQQECDAWVEETVIDEDEVIPEDESPELIE
ncbi:hypothetical protein Tco_0287602, partial [Tanacetum coccineum]